MSSNNNDDTKKISLEDDKVATESQSRNDIKIEAPSEQNLKEFNEADKVLEPEEKPKKSKQITPEEANRMEYAYAKRGWTAKDVSKFFNRGHQQVQRTINSFDKSSMTYHKEAIKEKRVDNSLRAESMFYQDKKTFFELAITPQEGESDDSIANRRKEMELMMERLKTTNPEAYEKIRNRQIISVSYRIAESRRYAADLRYHGVALSNEEVERLKRYGNSP